MILEPTLKMNDWNIFNSLEGDEKQKKNNNNRNPCKTLSLEY